ncbi:unnamed protein product [Soboliphyme baturini]|uniref:PBPb domain-containing protein n=1 Tax=Soboliphyme baturini TaxID=241478 RepID=A0A183IFH3_9BILA|nr:unnamed protein product [Soboliphyme baturini]
MNRQVIRVGVSPWANLMPHCIRESLETDCFPGFELEVFRTFSMMLNLSLRFVYSSVPGCGYSENDSLIAMLRRREIDITGNLCNLQSLRVQYFQPSQPVLSVPLGFLVNLPEDLHYEFKPLSPFQMSTWYFIILIFASLFLAVMLEKMILDKTRFFDAMQQTAFDFLSYMLQYRVRPNILKWVLIIFIFAFLKSLYSTYIREALMAPYYVQQPFEDQETFLNQLVKKQYRIIDYKQKGEVRVHGLTPSNEKRLQQIINDVGYLYVENTSNLLSVLSKNRNGILAKNSNQLLQYLSSYNESYRFWKLPIRFACNNMCYFWNRDFSLADKINQAIIELNDFILNEETSHLNENVKFVESGRIVRPPVSIERHKTLKNYEFLFMFYGIILAIALSVWLLERLIPRFGAYRLKIMAPPSPVTHVICVSGNELTYNDRDQTVDLTKVDSV